MNVKVLAFHQPMDCLFKSLSRLTFEKHPRSALLAICKEKPRVTYIYARREPNRCTPKYWINIFHTLSIKIKIITSRIVVFITAKRFTHGELGMRTGSSWLVYTHYSDVIMGAMASQLTSLTSVCSTVYSGADQRTHQSSASLAFVRGIHWWPVNSPHKWPVTRKMFPFDDVIMGLFSKHCQDMSLHNGAWSVNDMTR